MTHKLNALFLCTANSARSIMAASVLLRDGAKNFQAFSAGNAERSGQSICAEGARQLRLSNEQLLSKSWEVFTAPNAPNMDFVITVCDTAAGETCPLWPGRPISAHWGIEDPAAVEGSDTDKQRAFVTAFRYLRDRISLFTSLPIASLGRLALKTRLQEIGRMEGATSRHVKAH
jgi:arsenate reductase